jgi:hypothetical protein
MPILFLRFHFPVIAELLPLRLISCKSSAMNYLEFYKKIQTLPAPYQAEVEDFIDFLKTKQKKVDQPKKRPVFGSAMGQFKMSPDFDKPLDDFADYM